MIFQPLEIEVRKTRTSFLVSREVSDYLSEAKMERTK